MSAGPGSPAGGAGMSGASAELAAFLAAAEPGDGLRASASALIA
jgi:hypothetical protein